MGTEPFVAVGEAGACSHMVSRKSFVPDCINYSGQLKMHECGVKGVVGTCKYILPIHTDIDPFSMP